MQTGCSQCLVIKTGALVTCHLLQGHAPAGSHILRCLLQPGLQNGLCSLAMRPRETPLCETGHHALELPAGWHKPSAGYSCCWQSYLPCMVEQTSAAQLGHVLVGQTTARGCLVPEHTCGQRSRASHSSGPAGPSRRFWCRQSLQACSWTTHKSRRCLPALIWSTELVFVARPETHL